MKRIVASAGEQNSSTLKHIYPPIWPKGFDAKNKHMGVYLKKKITLGLIVQPS